MDSGSTFLNFYAFIDCASVFSQLDYCNVVLTGLPVTTLMPLQHVLHAVARLVLEVCSHDTRSAGSALVANPTEDKVQAVPSRSQD